MISMADLSTNGMNPGRDDRGRSPRPHEFASPSDNPNDLAGLRPLPVQSGEVSYAEHEKSNDPHTVLSTVLPLPRISST